MQPARIPLETFDSYLLNLDEKSLFLIIYTFFLAISELFSGFTLSAHLDPGPFEESSCNSNYQRRRKTHPLKVYLFYCILLIVRALATIYMVPGNYIAILATLVPPSTLHKFTSVQAKIVSQHSREVFHLLVNIGTSILAIGLINLVMIYFHLQTDGYPLKIDRLYVNSFLVSLFLLKLIGYLFNKIIFWISDFVMDHQRKTNFLLWVALTGAQIFYLVRDHQTQPLQNFIYESAFQNHLIDLSKFMMITTLLIPFVFITLAKLSPRLAQPVTLQFLCPEMTILFGLLSWSSESEMIKLSTITSLILTVFQLILVGVIKFLVKICKQHEVKFTGLPKRGKTYDVRASAEKFMARRDHANNNNSGVVTLQITPISNVH